MDTIAYVVACLVKVVFVILLVICFLCVGFSILWASWLILSNAQHFIFRQDALGQTTENAIKLQMDVYGKVVTDVLSPLLNALVAGFIAYVAGKTVGTVSYNFTEAKKNVGANPKQLELF